MREARLVVEFPSGAFVLLPSAAMRHGNTTIQPGETRTSITQYTAGGLFRWVDQGYRTREVMEDEDHDAAGRLDAAQEQRWKDAVDRFSKVGELEADHSHVFYDE